MSDTPETGKSSLVPVKEVRYAPPSPKNGVRLPPGPGRPKGGHNKATLEAREFAKGILESPEYRESLKRRIANDTLAPNIEALLYYYRYGKPRESVDISLSTGMGLTEHDARELLAEAQVMAAELMELQAAQRHIEEKKEREETIAA